MKEEQNDIEQLIAKSLAGETTSVEEEQLASWLKDDPANQEIFEKSKKVVALTKNHSSETALDIDVNAEWHKFKSNVEGKTKTIEMVTSSTSIWYKVAATFLILLVSGAILYLSLLKNDETFYETAASAEVFVLPDSSTVTLNKNSTLAYSKDFGATDRKVKLTGEAFFEVTPNKKKPFIINTAEASVQVLGTSFNINAVESDKTEVTVATGLVALSSLETKASIKLNAGDKGVLAHNNDELSSSRNDDVNFLAWKTRTIIFENADLAEVISTLNHVYNMRLNLVEGVGGNCKVSVTFDNQSFDAVLNVLESTLELEIVREENQVNITNAGC
ncbi:FecR domain-containing protein [Fulvivirga sp.]|uniref:FecR family protein n=1 Tax=Fulvivirga sp. TaxID=1931237 RepID=UPI0032F01D55